MLSDQELAKRVTRVAAKTDPGDIEDRLHHLTDGTFRVVAFEVFDAPGALRRPDGDLWGSWVLGREEDVTEYIRRHGWVEYREQCAAGYEAEDEADGLPR